jgi:TrmH family RNA methyltransferase
MEHALTIASTRNPRVKAAVQLRKHKVRQETGRTLVEGYREIQRAVESAWQFNELYVCPELYLDENAPRLADSIGGDGIPVYRCSPEVFRKMSYRDTPDGLLALSPLVGRSLGRLKLPAQPLLLVAENLEKPGNLGTLLRTADAAGADAVIVCGSRTDVNNPNVIRASIGTLFFMPVAEASTQETIAWLEAHHIRSIAALPDAERGYTGIDMRGGIAIVVGSENEGLSRDWIEYADLHAAIPMYGRNDSLNVSSAAAVLLYEAVRQRKRRT